MTSRLPYVFAGVVVGNLISLGGVLLYRSAGLSPPPPSSTVPAQPPAVSQGHAGHAGSPAEPARAVDGPTEHAPLSQDNVMTISPIRLQSIGVRFELAERRPLERIIRTVGRVEIDERRLAHVNIKIEGWIDELYVNYTGERVTQGQLLFTVYSPELVATQREYLLALKSKRMLGGSEFPEVAEGAKSLLEVTRQRLQLWDIPEHQIQDLERTGTAGRGHGRARSRHAARAR